MNFREQDSNQQANNQENHQIPQQNRFMLPNNYNGFPFPFFYQFPQFPTYTFNPPQQNPIIHQMRQQIPNQVPKPSQQQLNHQIHHQSQNSEQIGKKKKSRKKNSDGNYNTRSKTARKVMQQKPGRNKLSNAFKAFFKLLMSKAYLTKIILSIQKIIEINRLNTTFQEFQNWAKTNIPYQTHYINKTQFGRVIEKQGDNGILLRILLRIFIKNEGITYIMTVNNRKRILPENKIVFLQGIREIDNIYFGCKDND